MTARSPSSEMGTAHDRVATPPTSTVQAPQAAMPHPYFVPVIFRSSRSTHRRGVLGSVVTSARRPLTLSVYAATMNLLTYSCGHGMPASTHARVAATNSSCVKGGVERADPSALRP